jgi:cell division protease FtsH
VITPANFLGLDLHWDLYTLSTVAMLVFMGALVYLVWRTLRLMPRTKPQQITPRSASSITWDDIAGVEETR